MLEYHAAYFPIEDGWYLAKVLDFPGAVSQGRTLQSARRMIRDSLEGLAKFILEKGEALPCPNPSAKDKNAKLVEKITLKVQIQTKCPHEKAKTPSASESSRVRLSARRRKTHNRL